MISVRFNSQKKGKYKVLTSEYEQRMSKLENYCKDNKLNYYPTIVKKRPDFYKNIENYICDKCNKDLPNQVNERQTIANLKCSYEIQGYISVNKHNHIEEIKYHEPHFSSTDQNGKSGTSFFLTPNEYFRLIESNTLINWHTHPINDLLLSPTDIMNYNNYYRFLDSVKKIKNYELNKEVFFLVHQPFEKETLWYKMKKF